MLGPDLCKEVIYLLKNTGPHSGPFCKNIKNSKRENIENSKFIILKECQSLSMKNVLKLLEDKTEV